MDHHYFDTCKGKHNVLNIDGPSENQTKLCKGQKKCIYFKY